MRRWLWLLVVVVVAGIGVAIYMLKPVTGPARDLTLTADATHGAYLIRVGGCVSCHTDPDPDDDPLTDDRVPMMSGGAGLPTPFGTFYPPNITSHAEAGIGDWTLEQFSKAMSDGEGPQGHLYPAFPYDSYTLMSDQEVVDLFAALKDVPADATPSKAHDVGFPFNVRLALAGWKNLFFHPARFTPDLNRSEQWNRGAYLANGPSHCVVCHSPRNLLGGMDKGTEFAGNPAGGPGGRAPAITRAALTEKGYDETALASVLVDGFTPNFDALGGAMGEVILDGTMHWTEADRAAVAHYLLSER
jgi:mono/diheme cytochrome c family protein